MRLCLVRDALFVGPIVVLVLVSGCRDERDRAHAAERREVGDINPNAGAESLVQRAIDDVARTRCTHEEHCGRVGDDKRFSNDVACVEAMKERVSSGINARLCPEGVRPEGLRACLDAVRNLSCTVGYDAVPACERASICAGVNAH
jgi:hypothetical protein